jgi:hypothetical protein
MSADATRSLVNWMVHRAITRGSWNRFIDHIPASRVYLVADQARACARAWNEFADAAEAQVARGRGIRTRPDQPGQPAPNEP